MLWDEQNIPWQYLLEISHIVWTNINLFLYLQPGDQLFLGSKSLGFISNDLIVHTKALRQLSCNLDP